MRRSFDTWMVAVLTSLSMILFGSIALAQQEKTVGKVAALEGTAYVLHKGSTESTFLTSESPVYQEDIIQTEAASKIKLVFLDGTSLNLGEHGTLKITQFVYSPEQKIQTAILTIAAGAFRAVVEKLLPKSKLEVTTHTAVAAIRGTDWMGEVTADSSAFVVLEGRVTCIFNANPAVRGRVHLFRPGLGTTVRADQPPTRPNRWSEERVSALKKATELP